MTDTTPQPTEAELAAEERAERAERALAFAKLGIDIDKGPGKWLFAGYDEDLEPDKIRAAAIEAGALAAEEPTPPAPPPPAQVDPAAAAQQTFQDRHAGGTPGVNLPSESPNPVDEAFKKFHGSNGRIEDRQLELLGDLHAARESGDARVMFDQGAFNKAAAEEGRKMRTRGAPVR